MRAGRILIVLLGCALPAQAELVTFEYHAVVDGVTPPWNQIGRASCRERVSLVV